MGQLNLKRNYELNFVTFKSNFTIYTPIFFLKFRFSNLIKYF